jgi:DNA-directed RNA polymerase subunit L
MKVKIASTKQSINYAKLEQLTNTKISNTKYALLYRDYISKMMDEQYISISVTVPNANHSPYTLSLRRTLIDELPQPYLEIDSISGIVAVDKQHSITPAFDNILMIEEINRRLAQVPLCTYTNNSNNFKPYKVDFNEIDKHEIASTLADVQPIEVGYIAVYNNTQQLRAVSSGDIVFKHSKLCSDGFPLAQLPPYKGMFAKVFIRFKIGRDEGAAKYVFGGVFCDADAGIIKFHCLQATNPYELVERSVNIIKGHLLRIHNDAKNVLRNIEEQSTDTSFTSSVSVNIEENIIELRINNATATIGNLIASSLPEKKYATVRYPHPAEKVIVVRLDTSGNVKEALDTVITVTENIANLITTVPNPTLV